MNLICALALGLCLASVYRSSIASNTNTKCIRGDGIPGYCTPIRRCPKIADINKRIQRRRLTSEDRKYIRNSRCPNNSNGNVCCEKEEIARGMQVLLKQGCGYFGGTKKTYGGHMVKLMSRPWMALLMFRGVETNEFACGGSLITERFVLTAAHCFNNQELLSVRLGEHQISTDIDCEVNNGKRKCAPPVQDIGVERIIVHEGYIKETGHNDIALIKLSRDVELKDSVRPICLPVNKTLQEEPEEMEMFHVTGWGKTENMSMSDVPMETEIDAKKREDCGQSYNRNIIRTQLCAGHLGKDSCNGDSGGPLFYISLYNDLQRYVQFGIVSYGSRNCADGHPGVYTNVGGFIYWIAENLIIN